MDDMSNKIRMAALQALNPQELQLIQKTITPAFVQTMAKLFGDQAVVLLQPLVGLGQNQQPSLGQQYVNPMMGQDQEDQADQGSQGEGQEPGESCPYCGGGNPNCPMCGGPTPVNFGSSQ